MKLRYLLAVVLVLCVTHPLSATAAPGHFEELMKAYKAEKQYMDDAVNSGKAFHVVYITAAEMYDEEEKGFKMVTAREELKAGKKFRYVKSKSAEVFMDEKDIFTIYSKSNVLMRMHSVLKTQTMDAQVGYFKMMHDSTLRLYNVVSSVKEKLENRNVIRFTLVPKDIKKVSSSKIEIYFDEQDLSMRKVYMEMTHDFAKVIKTYTLTVLQRDQVEIGSEWSDLRSKFLNGNGTLKYPYNKYHLKDLTKKK